MFSAHSSAWPQSLCRPSGTPPTTGNIGRAGSLYERRGCPARRWRDKGSAVCRGDLVPLPPPFALWALAFAAAFGREGPTQAMLQTDPYTVRDTGLLPGCASVYVDKFSDGAYGSSVYILSHAHADHATGLSHEWSRGTLYCTSISAAIVKRKGWVGPGADVRTREAGETFTIEEPMTQRVLVLTFVEANHCPGAIMVVARIPPTAPLMRGPLPPTAPSDGDSRVRMMREYTYVVHTGDFRYKRSLEQEPSLEEASQASRTILCLDTTFADRSIPTFPSRERGARGVVELLDSLGGPPAVLYSTLGDEPILRAVAEKYPIAIAAKGRFDELELANEGMERIASFGGRECCESHVLVVGLKTGKLPSSHRQAPRIRASAQHFIQNDLDPQTHQDAGGLWRVFYSSHSSFDELRSFVAFLTPMQLVCLVPPSLGGRADEEFDDLIRLASTGTVDGLEEVPFVRCQLQLHPQSTQEMEADTLMNLLHDTSLRMQSDPPVAAVEDNGDFLALADYKNTWGQRVKRRLGHRRAELNGVKGVIVPHVAKRLVRIRRRRTSDDVGEVQDPTAVAMPEVTGDGELMTGNGGGPCLATLLDRQDRASVETERPEPEPHGGVINSYNSPSWMGRWRAREAFLDRLVNTPRMGSPRRLFCDVPANTPRSPGTARSIEGVLVPILAILDEA